MQNNHEQVIITEQDIQHLPVPVQKYLTYTGAIGKSRIHNMRLEFAGFFKTTPKGKYLNFNAEQYNFFENPKRFFYMRMPMLGIPMHGLHVYKDAKASMKIKMASLITLVDAKGEKMDQGETVTLLNDMCFMAPASLIYAPIEWLTIDSLTVKAIFTNGGNKISALLYFNEKYQLINFISMDRFLSSDGKTFLNYPWPTPVTQYKEIDGRMLPCYGEATWSMPEGDFVYGKFHLQSLKYNCK